METIDVPETTFPREGEKFDGVALADALLTSLAKTGGGILQAEQDLKAQGPATIIWELENLDRKSKEVIMTQCNLGLFRNVLARFGHHYMGGHVFNGYALRFLCQGGQIYRCHFYLSNGGQSGFWIRIYASKVE